MPLKKAKRIQTVAAVFLGVCGVMVLGIGFFRGWNGWNLGVALLVSAGYVALHGYFHRNDTTPSSLADFRSSKKNEC